MKTVTAVLLIGMLLLLAGTNPEPDEFREWLRLQVLSRAEVESPVITTFATVLGLDKVVVNALVSRSERKDFILFSVYTLSISASETWNIVGVLNHFMPLRDMSYVLNIDRLWPSTGVEIAAQNYDFSVSTYTEGKGTREVIDITVLNAKIKEIVVWEYLLRDEIAKII